VINVFRKDFNEENAFVDKIKVLSSGLNMDLKKRIIKCFVSKMALPAETWIRTESDKI